MAITLQDVSDRITRDCLNRPSLQPEAIRAIQAAIRHYERERWPWNEVTTTLTAVVASATIPLPTDFFEVDLMEIIYNSDTYPLTSATFAEVRRYNGFPFNDVPEYFTIRDYTIHLSPLPASNYPIICHYRRKLPELSSDTMTASNKWLSAASDVIVWHAAKLVWSQTLRNTEEAQKCYALEQTAYNELCGYRAQREVTKLSPSSF